MIEKRNPILFLFLSLTLMFPSCIFSTNVVGSGEEREVLPDRTCRTRKPAELALQDKIALEAMRFGENWRAVHDRESWQRYSTADGDFVELVIGLNDHGANTRAKLSDLLSDFSGKIADQVRIKGETRALVVKIPIGYVKVFVERALESPYVRYAEPNARMSIDYIPNDPYWPKQWGPAEVQGDFAWNTTLGSPSVLVAVVDTGIDYTHPDLQANYVPLGYDWVNNDTDPMDDHGHGTHVAGIIAAKIDNNEGIAGLAQVKIMAEKGLSSTGSGSDDQLAKAIIHATDQGAKIISMSWGGYFEAPLIHDALKYAYAKGVLLVAAAGNDPVPIYHFPAVYEEVVAVGATNRSGTIADFSTYGDWVDISAPGVKIYSAISKDHPFWNRTYPYDNASGTSMACPHVSGVAALAWSQFPSLTRDELKLRLYSTADDLGYKGFDPHFGHGRINAKSSLEPKPDHELILWKWKHKPYAKLDEINNFTVSVFNYGNADEENVAVQLLANDSVVDSSAIAHFGAGTFETVVLSWNATIDGVYNVTALITSVAGEKATNNAVWVKMLAGSRVSLRVPTDYPTIQEAVYAAMPGDTIEVAAGIYNEYVFVFTPGLKLVGENMYTTIVDGSNTGTSPFLLWSVGYISISGFTFQNGWEAGLINVGEAGGNFNVTNNILNGPKGSVLLWVNDTTVSGNLLISSEISIQGYRNVITNNVGGSLEVRSGNNTVSDNNVSGSIWIEGNGNVASHNSATDSDAYSAFTVKGEQNTITDNEVTNGRRGFTIFGKKHIIARNEVINVKSTGIQLEASNDSRFESNRIVGASRSLYLQYDCYNNTFVGNTIKDSRWHGIDVVRSDSNLFTQNVVSNSINTGIYVLLSDSNSFIGNTSVSGSEYGVYLGYSNGNVIAENVTLRSNGYGIFFESSSDNRIYHNNFMNNTHHVNLASTLSNTWEYAGRGNYWDDYLGVDRFSGPYQNVTGSDGIGDTPYVIDANNIDFYPAMKPFIRSAHDIGIVRITVPKTSVVQGTSLQVNVTVYNYGLFAEDFNVSLVVNASIIQTVSATLAHGTPMTIMFSWNTTGVAKGYYALAAIAHPVPEEDYTEDNQFEYGNVRIVAFIMGDITGPEGWPDGKVDIRDIALIAKYFGQNVPPAPIICDLSGPSAGVPDGKVDIRDIAIAAKNFGKADM